MDVLTIVPLQADPIFDALIKSLISRADIVIFLLLTLVAGARGMWVFGHHYNELRLDRDYWRALATRGTALAEKAVTAVEKTGATP